MANELELVALVAKRLVALEGGFTTLSKQPGPKGLDGKDGTHGVDGKHGVNGKDGKHGVNGVNGKHGVNGKDGERGPKGDTGPVPDHQWRGTKLRFKKPDETWGKFVDLKGPPGSGGGGGTVVVSSPSGASDPAPTSPAFTYEGGKLVGVTYADGSTKDLTYVGGRLSRTDFLRTGYGGVRKDLTYNPDGTLAAVEQSAI